MSKEDDIQQLMALTRKIFSLPRLNSARYRMELLPTVRTRAGDLS